MSEAAIDHSTRQRMPKITVDEYEDDLQWVEPANRNVDIMPSLIGATSVADAEQQADDVIGRQQSQRQRWVDRLDAAMESGLEDSELWSVTASSKPLADWTASWAVDRRLDGVDLSDMYLNGKRTVSLYIGGKTLIIVSERIDTTGPVPQ